MPLLLPRLRRSFLNNFVSRLFIGLVFVYVYCEYLIYYVTQIQCGWAILSKEPAIGVEPVYAMVIADTHLLGSRNGHWFDKWRREWQMHRAFQTAMTLHNPEVVFVLGDLFDEGQWCPEKEFNDYVERFYRFFEVPETTAMYSVVGNHDIGFHYRITPHLAKRFERRLNSPPVQLVTIRGNHFVLINSMAMEGDGCTLCARTVAEIANISIADQVYAKEKKDWNNIAGQLLCNTTLYTENQTLYALNPMPLPYLKEIAYSKSDGTACPRSPRST
uniref:Calcineurin-like phosphoesterase domain-containing protein n=1 Tax=Heliothis virescens TaxID=7102 RepID=A0A2A4JEK1_HELVI